MVKTIKVYNVSPKIMGFGKPPVTLRLGVAEVDRAGFVRALTPKNTALRKMIAIGGLRLDTGEHVLEVRKPRKTPLAAHNVGNIKSGDRPEKRTVRPLHGTQAPCVLMLALLDEIDAGHAPPAPEVPAPVAAPDAALDAFVKAAPGADASEVVPDAELREALTKLGFKPRKNARRDTLEAKYLDLSGVHWPNGTPAPSLEGAPE